MFENGANRTGFPQKEGITIETTQHNTTTTAPHKERDTTRIPALCFMRTDTVFVLMRSSDRIHHGGVVDSFFVCVYVFGHRPQIMIVPSTTTTTRENNWQQQSSRN